MSSVPDLKELCLDSIAKNLVFHSERFQAAANCEELQLLYEAFQFLFSDQLLRKICDIHENCGNPKSRLFADYLFSRRKWKGDNLQSCLDFVFNKFSKNIFVSCPHCIRKKTASWKVTSHIFSKCEDPRELDLTSSNLKQSDFLRALPKWHKLVKLDISFTNCTNNMVCKIWYSLPELQELGLSYCRRISDKCLYHLCKSSWETMKSPFCVENGACVNMGKKLRCFTITETNVTESGIACALLHLQSLKVLENDVNLETEACAVACGIIKANEISIRNGQLPLRLQLREVTCTRLLTPEKLKKVLSVCRSLNNVRLFASTKNLAVLAQHLSDTIESVLLSFTSASILDALVFQNFLLKMGGHLNVLALNVKSGVLKTRHFVEMLKSCPNLRKLFIGRSSFIGESNYDDVYNIPESVRKLNELCLFAKVAHQERLVNFFLQLIKRAEDLEALWMSCCFLNSVGCRLEQKDFQKIKLSWRFC